MTSQKTTECTLIVLQHGMWGMPIHMRYLEKQLIKNAAKEIGAVVVLNVGVNRFEYTYDGIDVCGQRLADKIQRYVADLLQKQHKKVTRITMAGYSMGGLMLRYAIGVLGKAGFFDQVEPLLFVSLATPHLGACHPPSTLFGRGYDYLCSRVLSRTGEQLQLLDTFDSKLPILAVLADPNREYFQYLAQFKARRVYANIVNDRTVPYCSAALEAQDDFHDGIQHLAISCDTTYPSIVADVHPADSKQKQKKKKKNKNFYQKLKRFGKKTLRYTIYATAPLWFPPAAVLVLSFIGIQCLLSRLRLAMLDPDRPFETVSTASSQDERQYLLGTTTASWSPQQKDDEKQPFRSDRQPLTSIQLDMLHDLCQLEWDRVLVCIDSLNAHASMVCREKAFTNHGGRAAVRHFVDTTLASLSLASLS